MAEVVAPPQAPRGREHERRPSQVHQRTEHVGAEREVAERVHEGGVEGVVGLDDVGPVGQPDEAPALHEAGGISRVVPERVGMGHPPPEGIGDVRRPLRRDDRAREHDRDDLLADVTRWAGDDRRGGRRHDIRGTCRADPQPHATHRTPGGEERDHDRDAAERIDGAEQLRDTDGRAQRERHLRQTCPRTRPLGEQRRAQVPRAPGEADHHRAEADDADEVLTQGQPCARPDPHGAADYAHLPTRPNPRRDCRDR